MNKKKLACLTAAALVLPGLPYKTDLTHYEIKDKRIHSKVKMAVLADVHCRSFGYKQHQILPIINREKPDMIMIPGDLFDKGKNYDHVFQLMDALKNYPIYFTSGNHERRLKSDMKELREKLQKLGVHVLEDRAEMFIKEDTQLEIAGMSDHGHKPIYTPSSFSSVYQSNCYRILLSHRPDFRDFYADVDCDLIICGHNHGGQWRIPFTHQGLFTPGDGLFPKYTEGMHDLNGRRMVISRGLAVSSDFIVRLYNNPEIVFVGLRGE